MNPTLSLPRRTSDRSPEPPFGYVGVGTAQYREDRGFGFGGPRIVTQCTHLVTGERVQSVWEPETGWSEWCLMF